MPGKSVKTPRRAKTPAQAEFAFKVNGGARPGSGRKRSGPRPLVPHRERGRISAQVPALVTVRLIPALASLRRSRELEVVRSAIRAGNDPVAFGIVHYSIQTNHLHMIVEAWDRDGLSAGMKGLLVRIARGLNRLWRRRGSIFADRYHVRALRSPREVRNALVYVLHNARKHEIAYAGPDPCSSGPWFEGWDPGSHGSAQRPARPEPGTPGGEGCARLPPGSGTAAPRVRSPLSPDVPHSGVVAARTWLLSTGWKRWGLIGLAERPAAQEVRAPVRKRAG